MPMLISSRDITLLDKVARGPFATALARGNAHQAKQIRVHFERIANALTTAYRKLDSSSAASMARL